MKCTWTSTVPGSPTTSARLTPTLARRPSTPLTLTSHPCQIWEGFGGCFNELGWIALSRLPAARRQTVIEALFHPHTGCRFNFGRLPIGASDYAAAWYSHDEIPGDRAMKHFSIARDHQYLIPYIRSALALRPDLTLFASPWSPPTWMKSPPVYNYGTLIWTPANLKAYALYFVKFVQAYQKAGITIRQIHPQNEPVADQKFPSCLWTGEQLREFIVRYLGPAFRQHGLDTEIWLGTLNTDDYDGFPLTVLRDPRAHREIAGISFQWAGRNAIQRTHAAWPEKRLMQSENECGDGRNSWDYAGYIFNLIRHYLCNGANSYIYWNMVLDKGGRSTWGWLQNSMITIDGARVIYNPEFYVLRHFARAIAPGARRLETGGAGSGNAVAFVNPDGSRVAVIRNPLAEPVPLDLSVESHHFQALLAPESINTLVCS
jgi:glucosylceramidase